MQDPTPGSFGVRQSSIFWESTKEEVSPQVQDERHVHAVDFRGDNGQIADQLHRFRSGRAPGSGVKEEFQHQKYGEPKRHFRSLGTHRASGVLDPAASEDVKLALKEMGRNSTARQKQARGLVWEEIELFLSVEPRNLRDIRDRALVAVAYDTSCRREELVSLLVADIEEGSDGSGSVLIRRSKTDTTGEGATAYLSPLTMRLLSH